MVAEAGRFPKPKPTIIPQLCKVVDVFGFHLVFILFIVLNDCANCIAIKAHWFFRFEYFLIGKSSFLDKCRGVAFVQCLLLWAVWPRLGLFLAWLTGYMVMPVRSFRNLHWNASKFHFGSLNREQADLREVEAVQAEPARLCREGIVLKSGELLACDVIICATGYFADVQLVKDGKKFVIDDKEPLLHHALVPTFPCLMFSHSALFHVGPARGVTQSAYISYVLNELTVDERAVRQAQKYMCKQSVNRHFVYGDHFVDSFVLHLVDLILAGILPVSSFVAFAFNFFVFSIYEPMWLNVGKHKVVKQTQKPMLECL